MKIIFKKLCFNNKYNTCFNVSVLDGNLYYLCVCNKGDQKNPLNSVSAEILLHKKRRSFSSNAGKRILFAIEVVLFAIEVVLTRDC